MPSFCTALRGRMGSQEGDPHVAQPSSPTVSSGMIWLALGHMME